MKRFAFVAALVAVAAWPGMVAGLPDEQPANPETNVARVTGTIRHIDVMDRTTPPPFQPVQKEIAFEESKPADFPALEQEITNPHYGSVEVFGRKNFILLAQTGSDSPGPDFLAVDLNGDRAFGEGETREIAAQKVPTREGGELVRGNVAGLTFRDGDRGIQTLIGYLAWPDRPLGAGVIGLTYVEAPVEVAGGSYVVVARDGDLDGKYAGQEDGYIVKEADAPAARPLGAQAFHGFMDKYYLADHLFSVRLGDDLAMTVTAELADGPDPATEARQRKRVEEEWSERFDAEREQFIAARGVDTTRPLAKAPIQWRFVTFAKAKEMAKAEGKPLFVDVLAFWCVWCYRMDYYTYPDAEVAQLLNEKFIPVKIIQEQDRAGDYNAIMAELGARGIPAMGIWNPEGELVHKIGGWKNAGDFVVDLKEGLAAAAGASEEDSEEDDAGMGD